MLISSGTGGLRACCQHISLAVSVTGIQHRHSSLYLFSGAQQGYGRAWARQEMGTRLLCHTPAEAERELESEARSWWINPSKGHTVAWLDT